MLPVDILAIGAHPDDVELACSGTLLRHIAAGYSVALLDLTRGELGTRGTPEIRDQEAAESCRKMGAVLRANLGFADGFFANDREHQIAIIEMIRLLRPQIVLANAVNDRHPDHGRAAALVREACFLSGLRKIETTWEGAQQEAWRPNALYHYIQDYDMPTDFIVDISSFMEAKLDLIRTFKSQFFDPNSQEPETPISSAAFLEAVVAKARVYGRPAGYAFAEGFVATRPPAVQDIVKGLQ
jgi:bacillithiol biosynthesis deacetylase BshB1